MVKRTFMIVGIALIVLAVTAYIVYNKPRGKENTGSTVPREANNSPDGPEKIPENPVTFPGYPRLTSAI